MANKARGTGMLTLQKLFFKKQCQSQFVALQFDFKPTDTIDVFQSPAGLVSFTS